MKKYISVHRTDATLLATNVDWKICRVDSVNRKKGGQGRNAYIPLI